MKNNNHIQDQIDDYLLDLLSNEERQAFEQLMADDEVLRKEVELQREIINAIQQKGEQKALEEMSAMSSEEEMRKFIDRAESKYHKSVSSRKKGWELIGGIAVGIAAAIVVMFIIHRSVAPQPTTDWEKMYAESVEQNRMLGQEKTLLSDSLTSLKSVNNEQIHIIDSLRKAIQNHPGSREHDATLLALLIKEDEVNRGNGHTLTFKRKGQTACNPARVEIEWTPVNKSGNVQLYIYDKYGDKMPVEGRETIDYDLRKGSYMLKGLASNTLYLFEIRSDGKTYEYPFITQ